VSEEGKTIEKKGTKITAPDTPIVQTVMQMARAMGNIHQNWSQYPKCTCDSPYPKAKDTRIRMV
jgi:hypothetical protein